MNTVKIVDTTIIAILSHILRIVVTMEIKIAINIPIKGAKNIKRMVLMIELLATTVFHGTKIPLVVIA